tara:strand:+ start:879 stop:1262 length:384 start_codon:yes stop_codon:yes gene_type:complete
VKLIEDFPKLLHKTKLPPVERCFVIEKGDEEFISEWIQDGELNCDIEFLMTWLEKKFDLKSKNISEFERERVSRIKKRFPLEHWRIVKLFCEHQRKYRYYKRAVEDVQMKTNPNMSGSTIMTIFSPK